jgi:peptide-methionine (S)-S-oxide reductase
MHEKATLAGGCFWCLEAVFQRLKGVDSVVSGYTGGHLGAPSYHDVCSGHTGHAEAVQISFDPATIDFNTLLEVFFALHDPTTLNRQGNDVGTQYRSAVFYHNESQHAEARAMIEALNGSGRFSRPIVTELHPAGAFYPAETEHQNYYNTHSWAPYCQVVIEPKVRKLLHEFGKLASQPGRQ